MTLGTPHHGSVHAWLFPGTCLASCGRAMPGSPSSIAAKRRPPASASCRCGHGTIRWSRRRRARGSPAPRTSRSSGIGHNALLGDRRVFALVAAELTRCVARRQGAPSQARSCAHRPRHSRSRGLRRGRYRAADLLSAASGDSRCSRPSGLAVHAATSESPA